MFEYIHQFEYEYNKKKLLLEAQDSLGYEPYFDPWNNTYLRFWEIKHIKSGYGNYISEYFQEILQCKIRPRFYHLHSGFKLDLHVDRGTLCSINFILNDTVDPIEFEHTTISYSQAVLDVTKKHGVASSSDRYLFKMSISDKRFEEVSEIIENYKQLGEF